MSNAQLYLAYPETASFASAIENFEKAYAASPNRLHKQEMIKVIEELVELIIQKQVLDPMDAMGSEGTVVKIMHAMIGVIRKTSSMLASKLIGGMDEKEQVLMKEHIESLRIEFDGVMHTALPIDADKGNKLIHSLQEALSEGRTDNTVKGLVYSLNTVVDVSLDGFMQKPISLLKLGRIMRGVVSAAESTMRKATTSSNEKVVHQLRGKKFIEYAEHMMSNLLEK